MESKYFCGICGTNPDQLSHHKSHLQTKKHKDNCEQFVIDMKIFSLIFRQVDFKKWHISEYASYIISKYTVDTTNKIFEDGIIDDINIINDVKKWLFDKRLQNEIKYGWELDSFDGKPPQKCYEDEHNCILNSFANNEFKNWAINRILKYKETIQTKPSRQINSKIYSRSDNHYKLLLSRHINIKFNKIKDIRNGLINLSYLSKPNYLLQKEDDMEIYNDEAVRYSCLLFDRLDTQDSLYIIYNGLAGCVDIEEHPEEKKLNTFYFYKEIEIEHTTKILDVINYGETRIEKKKLWMSCYMNNFLEHLYYLDDMNNPIYENNIPLINYSYIPNEDFNYFIKETLIEIFSGLVTRTAYVINQTNGYIFVSEWKNPKDRIVYDQFSKSYYLIKQNYSCFWRNEIMHVCNNLTEEEQVISLEQKLTEDQCKEYLDFMKNTDKNTKNLEQELKYYETELYKIKELSLSSDIIKSVIKICQYLFEYNDDLIEYYKNHMRIGTASNIQKKMIEKEAMEKEAMNE